MKKRDSDNDMLPCACSQCGYNIWISKDSLDRVGTPKCPVDDIPLEFYDDEEIKNEPVDEDEFLEVERWSHGRPEWAK